MSAANYKAARKAAVLLFVAAYLSENRYAPNLREIGAGINVSSYSLVKIYLDELAAEGLVELPLSHDGFRKPRVIIMTPKGLAEIERLKAQVPA